MKRYQWITLVFFAWAMVVAVKLSDRFKQVAQQVIEDVYYPQSYADTTRVSPATEVSQPNSETKMEAPKSASPNFPVFRMFHF